MPAKSEQSVESSTQAAGRRSLRTRKMLRAENNNLRTFLIGRGKRPHLTTSCSPDPSGSGEPNRLQKPVITL